jgi:hypothetical protein
LTLSSFCILSQQGDHQPAKVLGEAEAQGQEACSAAASGHADPCSEPQEGSASGRTVGDVSAHPAAARLQALAQTYGRSLDADGIAYRITGPLLLDVIHAACGIEYTVEKVAGRDRRRAAVVGRSCFG